MLSSSSGAEHRSFIRYEFDFAFNLDGNIERQLGKSNCTPAVGANDRTKQLENEIGKSVDDAGLLVESRRRVDHAEHPRPGGYPIEVTESALQASKDGKRSHSSGDVALLDGELTTQLAQRLSKRSVRVLRSMA